MLSAVLAFPFLAQGLAIDVGIPSPEADKLCQDYLIPVEASATVLTASYQPFKDNFDVVTWVNQLATGDTSSGFQPFSGKKNLTGSYSIGATFCTPKNQNANQKTVLLATHGLGFDRR